MQRALRAGLVPGLLAAAAFVALWLPRLPGLWSVDFSWESASGEWHRRRFFADAAAAAFLVVALVVGARRASRDPRASATAFGAIAAVAIVGALLAGGSWYDDAQRERVIASYTSTGVFYPFPHVAFGDSNDAVGFELRHAMRETPSGAVSLGDLPRTRGDILNIWFMVERVEGPARLVAEGLRCDEVVIVPQGGPDFHQVGFRCIAVETRSDEVLVEGTWPSGVHYDATAVAIPTAYAGHGSRVDERTFALGVGALLGAAAAAAVSAPYAPADGRRLLDIAAAAALGGASLAWTIALALRAQVAGTSNGSLVLLPLAGACLALVLVVLWLRAPGRATAGYALGAASCAGAGAILAAPTLARALPSAEAFAVLGTLATAVVAAGLCLSWWPRLAAAGDGAASVERDAS
jgi:hypothetical protein